uniref:diacylglycerol O-acyltransferase n=1 Tax=freshwater metagenome TaxID=449393 RepID=A0A6J5ZH27_9ZZZZ
MTTFDRLSALDAAFLDIETERAPMQVGWTMRFAGEAPGIEQLRSHVESRLESVPRLRRRIVEPAMGLGDPHWVDDQLFAIDRHVNVIHMVASDQQPALSAVAEELLSQPLDRSRPLWRLQLVTGLAEGGFAIIGQAHHALIDGLAALEIATIIFDGVATPNDEAAARWLPEEAPSTSEVLTAAALSRIGAGSDVATTLVRSIAGGPAALVEAVTALVALFTPGNRTALENSASPRRRVAFASLPLERMQGAAQRHGVTINDVLLASSGGAVSGALARRGEQPDGIRVLVPTTVRQPGESAASHGNRISVMVVELPLNANDPGSVLRTVGRRTKTLKRAGYAGTLDTAVRAADLLAPPVRSAAVRAAIGAAHFTLVISNVPGPSAPLELAGRELEGIWPAVPLIDGHALSIGAISHAGVLHVGCFADAALVPDLDLIAADIAATFDQLCEMAPPQQAPWQQRARQRRDARRVA